MLSLRGKLLIASPHLLDPNFAHAVVLMVQHDEDGALGVVLNRPSQNTLAEVWREVLDRPCDNEAPIYVGGPCPGPLMAVHQAPECADLDVAPGLFFATQKEHLENLVQGCRAPLRVFSGYSGWAGGQVESELETGSWLLTDATEELVFGDDDELWKLLARRVGEDILLGALKIKHAPEDPSLN